ncbi:MAG: cold-shock protein [Bdellovibrionales bacterium]|nr:cold-shock protein [Bdellovibrionales bacterium]
MASGRVKWFNDAKGFGVIERGEGEEVFVHYSAIEGAGRQADDRKTLKQGESVRFDLYVGQKGLNARNVRRI